MHTSLWIGGRQLARDPFTGVSPFFEGYTYTTTSAGDLDIAAAIGAARQAAVPPLKERQAALERASQAFAYTDQDLEHAVRVTGMPITIVKGLFDDIPAWLRSVPQSFLQRYPRTGPDGETPAEKMAKEAERLLYPPEGFCYAVTPGNDLRASALAAANLCTLGVPFVLKAASQDAVAPLVVRALLEGGFDPNFASLVYFPRGDPRSTRKHFELVDASSMVWTFGGPAAVDGGLRYEVTGRRAIIDLPEGETGEIPKGRLYALLEQGGFRAEEERVDHFEGKTVIRHHSAGCVAIASLPDSGPLGSEMRETLAASLLFPLGCTAAKTILLVSPGTAYAPEASRPAEAEIAALLEGLVVGDPLDERTQVGYIHPRNLDYVAELVEKNRLRARFYGGERLSTFQARPLLVTSQEDLPDFFQQDLPAYVLALRTCASLEGAATLANRGAETLPRLAVSLLGFPRPAWAPLAGRLRARAVLIDRPTSQVVPSFHEGNDYASRLAQGRLLIL